MVIILKCIEIPNHYAVYQESKWSCTSIKPQKQTHRKGDQICGCQRQGVEGGRGLNVCGQKLQTSSNKINKCLPCGSAGKQSSWVQSLGWGDPLEKGKATHSSILTWRIPWTV